MLSVLCRTRFSVCVPAPLCSSSFPLQILSFALTHAFATLLAAWSRLCLDPVRLAAKRTVTVSFRRTTNSISATQRCLSLSFFLPFFLSSKWICTVHALKRSQHAPTLSLSLSLARSLAPFNSSFFLSISFTWTRSRVYSATIQRYANVQIHVYTHAHIQAHDHSSKRGTVRRVIEQFVRILKKKKKKKKKSKKPPPPLYIFIYIKYIFNRPCVPSVWTVNITAIILSILYGYRRSIEIEDAREEAKRFFSSSM